MKRVLSISGGGMRGVIPARALVELETRAGQPLHESFDLVAGTSTGGILACLIAAGVPAAKALEFYYKSGPKIFDTNLARTIYTGNGAIHTRYTNEPLKRELAACIGGGRLADAKTRIMVTTLTRNGAADVVKSWEPFWRELPLADAALMTSAAQTYFPQAEIRHGDRTEFYLDGGNVRNAPMACAALEALNLWWGEEILVVHLGTGKAAKPKALPNGGALAWAPRIFDCTTNADDSYDEYFCQVLAKCVPGFRYERFDVELESFPAMDDASGQTLGQLQLAAGDALAAERGRVNEICKILREAA